MLGSFPEYTKDDITVTPKGQVLEIPVESVLYHIWVNLFLPFRAVSQMQFLDPRTHWYNRHCAVTENFYRGNSTRLVEKAAFIKLIEKLVKAPQLIYIWIFRKQLIYKVESIYVNQTILQSSAILQAPNNC